MSWINVLSTNRNIAIVWRSDATLASSAVATLAQINLNGYVSPEAMNLHFHVSGGHFAFFEAFTGAYCSRFLFNLPPNCLWVKIINQPRYHF